MRKDLTELVFILDRSGSMGGLEDDTIGGFNSMIRKQQAEPGDVFVSTVLFSYDSKVIHDRVPLKQIQPLTHKEYSVGGSTALVDAIGGAIHHIGNVHKYARDEDVPEKTLFVITTDGMENASRRYSFDQVKSMIEFEKKKYGWEFLCLGANMDAVSVAGRCGISSEYAATYVADERGTALNYDVLGDAIRERRRCSEPISAEWKIRIEEDVRTRDH